MGHIALLSGGAGEALSKRLGSLSIGELRNDGIEPLAIASFWLALALRTTVIPRNQLLSIIESFDLGKFGRATAKFDAFDLAVNSQIVQSLSYDFVKPQLDEIGVTCNPDFWLAVRGNIMKVNEAKLGGVSENNH